MPEPCVHAPLLYESVAFLALMSLPFPPSLSNSAACFGTCLTLAA